MLADRIVHDEQTEEERDLDVIAAELVRFRADLDRIRQEAAKTQAEVGRKLDEVMAEQALVRHARTEIAERVEQIARSFSALATSIRKAGL